MTYLPTDAAERGEFPMFDGLLGYFPAALAWVSRCSKIGNDQHNAGEPLHWAMDKSTDHKNKIVKHLLDVGTDDIDEVPHSVKVAWRALALAQEDLMARKGAPLPHNATQTPKAPAEPINLRPGAVLSDPKDHRRVATPAEMDAYRQNGARLDQPGAVVRIGDTVRVIHTTAGREARGFVVGVVGKVASFHGKEVLIQAGEDTCWFHPSNLEWVRP